MKLIKIFTLITVTASIALFSGCASKSKKGSKKKVIHKTTNNKMMSSKMKKAPDLVASGKWESRFCTSCHGVEGMSANEFFPNLKGQKKDYLEKQLNDYKEGKLRYDKIMTPISQTLKASEIQALAAYYSSLPPPEVPEDDGYDE